jgi:apolipoprotein D and lipocalin family protein
MHRYRWILVLGGCLTLTTAALAAPPATVARVDLERYLGRWYEIARLPNRFQRHCRGNVTADYAWRDDGRLAVHNRCLDQNGGTDAAEGVARVVDPASQARLEVSFVSLFGWSLFWGDYWILDLDPDYRQVVVGTANRGYAWILSRTPTLTPAGRQRADQALRRAGYDPGALVDTAQGLPAPAAP